MSWLRLCRTVRPPLRLMWVMVQRSPFFTQSVGVSRRRRSVARVMIMSPTLARFPSPRRTSCPAPWSRDPPLSVLIPARLARATSPTTTSGLTGVFVEGPPASDGGDLGAGQGLSCVNTEVDTADQRGEGVDDLGAVSAHLASRGDQHTDRGPDAAGAWPAQLIEPQPQRSAGDPGVATAGHDG